MEFKLLRSIVECIFKSEFPVQIFLFNVSTISFFAISKLLTKKVMLANCYGF